MMRFPDEMLCTHEYGIPLVWVGDGEGPHVFTFFIFAFVFELWSQMWRKILWLEKEHSEWNGMQFHRISRTGEAVQGTRDSSHMASIQQRRAIIPYKTSPWIACYSPDLNSLHIILLDCVLHRLMHAGCAVRSIGQYVRAREGRMVKCDFEHWIYKNKAEQPRVQRTQFKAGTLGMLSSASF